MILWHLSAQKLRDNGQWWFSTSQNGGFGPEKTRDPTAAA
jgi:hypothetical protein